MAKTASLKKQKKTSNPAPKLGALPEWDLKDLYAGLDSPKLKQDLELAEERRKIYVKQKQLQKKESP